MEGIRWRARNRSVLVVPLRIGRLWEAPEYGPRRLSATVTARDGARRAPCHGACQLPPSRARPAGSYSVLCCNCHVRGLTSDKIRHAKVLYALIVEP